MSFWGKLKSVLKAPFTLPAEAVKAVGKIPSALLGAGAQVVRTAGDVAKSALPGLMQQAAALAPVAGGLLGGPIGQLGGQIVGKMLSGEPSDVSQAALSAAQHYMGGWAPPVRNLTPPSIGAGFPYGG